MKAAESEMKLCSDIRLDGLETTSSHSAQFLPASLKWSISHLDASTFTFISRVSAVIQREDFAFSVGCDSCHASENPTSRRMFNVRRQMTALKIDPPTKISR